MSARTPFSAELIAEETDDKGTRPRPWAWMAFVVAVASTVFAAVLNWQTGAVPARTANTEPAVVATGATPVTSQAWDCSRGRVYLTFDDGPGPGTSSSSISSPR